jgi:hypothetical protein
VIGPGLAARRCARPDRESFARGDGAATSVALSISFSAWLHIDSARPTSPPASASRTATISARSRCS